MRFAGIPRIHKPSTSGIKDPAMKQWAEGYNQCLDRLIDSINYRAQEAYWDDLRFPATSIDPPGLVGDPDYDTARGGWLFDASLDETLLVVVLFPHTWKVGSIIKPHVHWQPTTTNTGNVLWRMEYTWTNLDETESGSFTTLDALDAANGTEYKYQTTGLGDIDGTGKGIASIMTVKLSRIASDGTDTYTGDALLKEFDIHIQKDSLGSMRVLDKWI